MPQPSPAGQIEGATPPSKDYENEETYPRNATKWTPVKDRHGSDISADGGPQRILACSGYWALVEAHGARG